MTFNFEKVPSALKFVFGAVAGCGAATAVQPMNLVKNRMQVSGEGGAVRLYKSSWHCAKIILRSEGFLGFYSGLSGKVSIILY